MSGTGDERTPVPDRLVAAAAEFAVGVAAAGRQLRPALPSPAELRPFLRFSKLPPKAVSQVLRILEAEDEFRTRVGSVVSEDLLDEPGRLWLARPDGWEARLAELAAADERGEAAIDLRRAERRREAAEQVAARSVAEVAALRLELERAAGEIALLRDEAGQARTAHAAAANEITTVRAELRRTADRARAALERAERAEAAAEVAGRRAEAAERIRDEVLADRSGWVGSNDASATVLDGAARLAKQLHEQAGVAQDLAATLRELRRALDELEPTVRSGPASRPPLRATRRTEAARKPIALPGGVYGSSRAAAEHLVRVPRVLVLIDGYNVAKLGWPRLDLEAQREQCIAAAEDVARRFGTNIAVVFDGALVPGAAATGRRLVRVQYSAEGVTADDVLRAEVAAQPVELPVVVVTNDQAVVADVRGHGANVLASEQWLELAGR